MIIAKNFWALRKSHTCGGRSRSSQVMRHSSSMRQSSSTGPSRNACSSSDSVAGGERTRGELADDLGMGIGGKAQAAVGLRNDHREEFLGLEKVPHLRRQIPQLPGDAPLVEHAAELVDGAVEKRLLFFRQRRRR